jgi:hypothetical protein
MRRRGGDGEPGAAEPVRADRLQQRRRILDGVPAEIAVADGGHEQNALRDGVLDRASLDR